MMELPDKVFQAELPDIKVRRDTISDGGERGDTDNPLQRAVRAVQAVGEAETQVRKAEGQLGRFKGPTLEALRAASRIPGTGRMVRALESGGAPANLEALAWVENQLFHARREAERVARPSGDLGLVGLALSGGGIRSATFNLGVLQVFAKHGLLDQVDYISSVSGGGYTAGMLSSLLCDPEQRPSAPNFPLRHDPGKEESAVVKHLRSGASYLAPEGVLDKVRIPALFLRGLLVNLLLLLPYLLFAVVLTEIMYGGKLLEDNSGETISWTFYYRPTIVYAVCLGLWTLIYPIVRSAVRLTWEARNSLERAYALLFAVVVGMFIINTLPVAVLWFRRSPLDFSFVASGGFGTLLTIAAPLLPILLASGTPRVLATWRGKLMVYGLGLLGPIILLLIYLQLASWRVLDEDRVLRWLCVDANASQRCSTTWLHIADWATTIVRDSNVPPFMALDWGIVIAALVMLTYEILAVDVNLTSLHGFYRDRLSGAYLFRVRREKGQDDSKAEEKLEANDQQPLSGLAPHGSATPYHLINATLNLQGSHKLPGRKADFFLFSKRFIGSGLTGYCETTAMERADRRLDLATAVAVSGAALAPNMGTATNRALVFVMTLLNVRTGYWLPNPAKVISRFAFTGVGPVFMMRELFGLLDERSRYVNVSDGGHVENLGLYELLRRRCKYIIVCDSEADEKLTFGGLAKVMQYARIDGSIDIDIDLSDLRKNDLGLSQRHYAVGTIRYGQNSKGTLIYLKASLSGREREDIREYRIRSPSFPHESTREQFFNEGQFEAYRALGYHIASSTIGNRQFSGPKRVSIARWVGDLKQRAPRRRAPRKRVGRKS